MQFIAYLIFAQFVSAIIRPDFESDGHQGYAPRRYLITAAVQELRLLDGSVEKVYQNERSNPGEAVWDESRWFENEEMPLVVPVREVFEKEHCPVTDRMNVEKWKGVYYDIATQTKNQKPGYGPSGLRDDQHKDGKNARQIVSWLEEERFGDKPFFIAMGVHKPHAPSLAPDKYFDLYPKEELQFVAPPQDFWKQAPKSAISKRYEEFDFEFEVENSNS